jgi:hypothetical protein
MQVSTGKTAETNQVNILLHRGADYLLGCLMHTSIDYFKTSIPVAPGDNPGASVMTIQAWFGN